MPARLCYWHPDYVPETLPFQASQCGPDFFVFSDLRSKDEAFLNNFDLASVSVAAVAASDKRSQSKINQKLEKDICRCCNTANVGGLPPKNTINKRDFLPR